MKKIEDKQLGMVLESKLADLKIQMAVVLFDDDADMITKGIECKKKMLRAPKGLFSMLNNF